MPARRVLIGDARRGGFRSPVTPPLVPCGLAVPSPRRTPRVALTRPGSPACPGSNSARPQGWHVAAGWKTRSPCRRPRWRAAAARRGAAFRAGAFSPAAGTRVSGCLPFSSFFEEKFFLSLPARTSCRREPACVRGAVEFRASKFCTTTSAPVVACPIFFSFLLVCKWMSIPNSTVYW